MKILGHTWRWSPQTRARWQRFRGLKRAWFSLVTLGVLILFALGAELWVNSRALVVWDGQKLFFPTYGPVIPGTAFGLDYPYETNYRQLSRVLAAEGRGWVLLPLVPYNPLEQDFKEDGTYPPFAPAWEQGHFLGTDTIGRDLVARLVYGFRVNILFALGFVAITFVIGLLLGSLMGYWGGWFDILVQRLIEIWEQIPFLYIVMIIVSVMRPDILVIFALFVIFNWTGRTYAVRAMTYRERERDYVLAARAMGAPVWHILVVHILPNVIVVVVTILPFAVAGTISALAALDYLGFGIQPPTPSWGELLSQGLSKVKEGPWILASILTAMTSVLVMIAFVGEGLRDAFDPRKYTVYQ